MPPQPDSIAVDLALIKKDLSNIEPIYKQLVVALGSVTDISNNLQQVTAVQENRLSTIDKALERIDKSFDVLESRITDSLTTLSNRVTGLENWKWWIIGAAVATGIGGHLLESVKGILP